MGATKTKKSRTDGMFVFDSYNKWFNVAVILVCFLFLLGVRLAVNPTPTGDEPHYLIMDYSLIHDRDLSLANNYDRQTSLGYDSGILSYQGWPYVEDHYANKQYSVHGFGLPIFLLPGFLFAQKDGAVFQMVLLAAFVVWLTWVWTKLVTKNRKLAYVASGLLTICYFFNTLAGAIYPDMLTAALTLIALIATERYYRKPLFQLVIGLALGFLVLVHLKAIVIAAPVMLVLVYKLWKSDRKLPWLAIAAVGACVFYYFLTLYQWFGTLSLSEVEGGQSFGADIKHNLSAMLFDANRGLVIYNPILLLLFVGMPIWLKKHRQSLMLTLAALLPTIILLCMIPNWNGSASPVGRYIVSFLPVFIPAVAFAIESLWSKVWQRLVVIGLGSITFLITLNATFNKFPIIDNSKTTSRPILFEQIQQHTGWALDRLLPLYTNNTVLVSKHGWLKLLVGYLIIIGLVAYGFYLSKGLPTLSSKSS